MRYFVPSIAAAFIFVTVGLIQAAMIGQMLDGIRKPEPLEIAILYIGQLAIPVAAAVWGFRWALRTER